jgi:DNA repair exonuclease SbcCD ATPase subunit
VLFSQETRYTFNCVLNKDEEKGKQKICLLITNPDGLELDHHQLSGFETVILNIAISKSLLELDQTFHPDIFIIDESLDCIDSENFGLCIPRIFKLLREHFDTNIIISHRDIPHDLIDNHLRIKRYSSPRVGSYIE